MPRPESLATGGWLDRAALPTAPFPVDLETVAGNGSGLRPWGSGAVSNRYDDTPAGAREAMHVKRVLEQLRPVSTWLMAARWLPKIWFYLVTFAVLGLIWPALSRDLGAEFREVFAGMTGTGYDLILPASSKLIVEFFNGYLLLWLLWCLPGALLLTVQRYPQPPLTMVTSGCLTVTWLMISTDMVRNWRAASYSAIGEMPSPAAFIVKQILVAALILSPPLFIAYYRRQRLLDRYLLRSLLFPFVFCFIGVATLWIILDLSNNFPEFIEAGLGLREMLAFYGVQMPQTIVIVFPVAVLLAMLYALGRMSRANELISMLSAGISLRQILTPVFIIGAYAAFISLVCNYHWAPRSEGRKTALLEAAQARAEEDRNSSSREEFTRSVLYRNDIDHRTWFAGSIPYNLSQRERIRHLELYIDHPDGTPERTIVANQAFWWPPVPGQTRDDFPGHWTFYHGQEIIHQPDGSVKVNNFANDETDRLNFPTDWSESPWTLMSASFTPDYLSVQELTSYLKSVPEDTNPAALAPFRTHWHYRFAQPMLNLIVALIAAPLGIAFSRRGVVGGVAIAVVIVFFLLFVDSFFLNLARGNHFPAWLSVWCPHLIFGALGGGMLYLKSRNRQLPKLSALLPRHRHRPALPPRPRSQPTTSASAV